jgi:hypothetical protein
VCVNILYFWISGHSLTSKFVLWFCSFLHRFSSEFTSWFYSFAHKYIIGFHIRLYCGYISPYIETLLFLQDALWCHFFISREVVLMCLVNHLYFILVLIYKSLNQLVVNVLFAKLEHRIVCMIWISNFNIIFPLYFIDTVTCLLLVDWGIVIIIL